MTYWVANREILMVFFFQVGTQQDRIFEVSKFENKALKYTVFYKEHLYKELEAEKSSKNKEFLRNWPGWNKSSNLRNTKEH